MQELSEITTKYDPDYVREGLGSLEQLNSFALTFYKDVAEIYDCLTRLNISIAIRADSPWMTRHPRLARSHRQVT